MESASAIRADCRARAKAVRRAKIRQKNEPPLLTVPEERFNALSHGLGALLAAGAMGALAVKSTTGPQKAAAVVYGLSMVLMMLMSAVYHACPPGSRAKRICRRFDYSSIYLLIGGTFAPILLVYVGGRLGAALFALQWTVICAGVMLVALFGPGRWRPLHFTLYFLIGWSGLAFLPEFLTNSRTLLWFILAGGLVYTLGMIPFTRHRRNDHCVWHVCVLTAAALQWMGIYTQLY